MTPQPPSPELPADLADKRQLASGESFCFGCSPELPCFTKCCADVNILLTPIDVLRLSRRLGMTSTEFLAKHCLIPLTKDLKLPTVMLRMSDDAAKSCSFVAEHGCTVYEDRPWSCRMYPVGMALPPARAGFEPEPLYFLFEDEHCKGHGQGKTWTVEQWRADQGIEEREALEAGFREIVSHPWFIGGRQLDARRMEMFFTACYDLDKFRAFIFGSTFLQRFELEEGLAERLESDDDELLRFAFRWLRFALFAEPTLKTRKPAPAPRRTA
jgi:Fe-S-cluster containining protein